MKATKPYTTLFCDEEGCTETASEACLFCEKELCVAHQGVQILVGGQCATVCSKDRSLPISRLLDPIAIKASRDRFWERRRSVQSVG